MMYVRYIHNVVLIVYSVPVFGSGTSGGLYFHEEGYTTVNKNEIWYCHRVKKNCTVN